MHEEASLAVKPTYGDADVVLNVSRLCKGTMPGPLEVLIRAPTLRRFQTDVVLGKDSLIAEDFLSLPSGSYVIVGFKDELIVDGRGQ